MQQRWDHSCGPTFLQPPSLFLSPADWGLLFFFLMQNPCQLEAFLWIGWRVCGVSTAPDHQSASKPQEGRPCLWPVSYSLFVIASVWLVLRHWLNQDFWDVPCSSRKWVLLELVPQSPACMFVFLPGGGAARQKKGILSVCTLLPNFWIPCKSTGQVLTSRLCSDVLFVDTLDFIEK